MAVWIPNSEADSNAPLPYVSCLPRISKDGGGEPGPLTGVTDNPSDHPDNNNLGNDSGASTGDRKYMHYCTRILRWNDVDLENLSGSGTPDHVNKTQRFGDLGGYYMRYDGDGSANPSPTPVVMAGSGFDNASVFTRYRFPSEIIPYCYYGSRGDDCPVADFPFAGQTCGFIPQAADPSFFWTPSASDWTEISTGLNAVLGSYSTPSSLAAFNALDQTWNLAIVAWMWAGYQRGHTAGSRAQPYKGIGTRDVDDVDLFYFPFIY